MEYLRNILIYTLLCIIITGCGSNGNKLQLNEIIVPEIKHHQISVLLHKKVLYPSYFSRLTGELILSYQNDSIPPESQVSFHYGFKGEDRSNWPLVKTIEWQYKNTTQAKVLHEGVWQLSTLPTTLLERGGKQFFNELQFVVIIKKPDGSVSYDKGSSSAWGYYSCLLPIEDKSCLKKVALEAKEYCQLKIESIYKN